MYLMKDNSQWLKDVSRAADKAGNIKTLGGAIGLPDSEDKQMIRNYLIQYEKVHPGEIQFHRDAARKHIASIGKDNKFGVIEKEASRRYLFELPTAVGEWLEKSYPLMFRDKAHTSWFCKNFPELLIPEKY